MRLVSRRRALGALRLDRHAPPAAARAPARVDPPTAGELDAASQRAWCRTERQTFIPLPARRQAVFTIGVEVPAAGRGASTRRRGPPRCTTAIASMSAAVLAYRSLDARARAAAGAGWPRAQPVKTEPIAPARIDFDADGLPHAPDFGDVYHARIGALEQARHVFLAGNGLPERWRGRARFVDRSRPASAWATTSSPPGRPGATTRRAASGWSSSRVEKPPAARDDLRARARGVAAAANWRAELVDALAAADAEPAPARVRRRPRAAAAGASATSPRCCPQLRRCAPTRSTSTASRRRATRRCGEPRAAAGRWRAGARPAPPPPPGAWRGAVRDGLAAAGFDVERRAAAPAASARSRWRAARRASRRRRRRPRAAARPAPATRVVVGGGLAGAAAARALAARGLSRARCSTATPQPARRGLGQPGRPVPRHGARRRRPARALAARRGAARRAHAMRPLLRRRRGPARRSGLLRLDTQRRLAAMQALRGAAAACPTTACRRWTPRGRASARAVALALGPAWWFYRGGGWVDAGALVRHAGWRPRRALGRRRRGRSGCERRGDGWRCDRRRRPRARRGAGASCWPTPRDALPRLAALPPAGRCSACAARSAAATRPTPAPLPRLPLAGGGYAAARGPTAACCSARPTQPGDAGPGAARCRPRRSTSRVLAAPDRHCAAARRRAPWRAASAGARRRDDRLPLVGAVPDRGARSAAAQRAAARAPGCSCRAGSRGRLAPLLGVCGTSRRPWPLSRLRRDRPARWRARAARR
ncbi:MAG: hypothetical protein MZW92_18370 [Comamonadaceae bacterium]|nr:hypothetical protein [Comamonadaceae bacterium]